MPDRCTDCGTRLMDGVCPNVSSCHDAAMHASYDPAREETLAPGAVAMAPDPLSDRLLVASSLALMGLAVDEFDGARYPQAAERAERARSLAREVLERGLATAEPPPDASSDTELAARTRRALRELALGLAAIVRDPALGGPGTLLAAQSALGDCADAIGELLAASAAVGE